MRLKKAALVVAVFSSASMLCTAQAPAAAPTSRPSDKIAPAPAANAATAPAIPSTSSILQPSLDAVQQTLAGLNTARWKRGSVRDEANADIGSIERDMRAHMTPLMKDADAAQGALSKTLLVSRHLDALYDVLLRVVEAARIAAPDDQANALRQALVNLNTARLAFDDSMETAAGSQEKQLVDLRITVQKQAAFKCPAPPPAPVCPAPAKKPVKRKPKPPAATTPQKPATAPANGTAPKTGP
jgi:hypothetical protein